MKSGPCFRVVAFFEFLQAGEERCLVECIGEVVALGLQPGQVKFKNGSERRPVEAAEGGRAQRIQGAPSYGYTPWSFPSSGTLLEPGKLRLPRIQILFPSVDVEHFSQR